MKLVRRYVRAILLEKKWADFKAPKGKVISLTPSDFTADESPQDEEALERDLDDEKPDDEPDDPTRGDPDDAWEDRKSVV